MALIRSEISTYRDIVLAIDREIHGHGQKEITWDSFTDLDRRYCPHSVVIGRASDTLKQMGFMPTFTYDKEHLQNAMFPEDGIAPHSHGLTVEELLMLPKLLVKPVAIVSERADKTYAPGEEEYKALHFIFAVKNDDGQQYYRAIVQPQAHHNGLVVSGYASKVITFHKMESAKFDHIMSDVLDGKRQLLYFDSHRYLRINSQTKPAELCNYASCFLPIKGHFSQDPNLRRVAQNHQIAVQRAVTAELNKLIVGRSSRGESFPIFTSSLRALAYGDSIDQLRSAYNTIKRIIELTPDRILRLRAQEYADKSFARSYVRLMTHDAQQSYMDMAVRKIAAIQVDSQSDLDDVCNEIEKLTSSVPTLKNLGINFSDRVSGVQIVMNARQISGQFQDTLENVLANILRDKSNRVNEMQRDLDDQEYGVTIRSI
jgi:hypothetical protein